MRGSKASLQSQDAGLKARVSISLQSQDAGLKAHISTELKARVSALARVSDVKLNIEFEASVSTPPRHPNMKLQTRVQRYLND